MIRVDVGFPYKGAETFSIIKIVEGGVGGISRDIQQHNSYTPPPTSVRNFLAMVVGPKYFSFILAVTRANLSSVVQFFLPKKY